MVSVRTPTQSTSPEPRSFGDRLIGALELDPSLFAEVQRDAEALRQAALVVTLAAAVAAAPGLVAAAGLVVEPGPGLAGSVLAGVLGWLVNAGLVWVVGVRVLGHVAGFGDLLRPLGFATAPQLILLLQLTALAGLWVTVLALFWDLAAHVVAIRGVLGVTTRRALFVYGLAYSLRSFVMLFLVLLGGGGVLFGSAVSRLD